MSPLDVDGNRSIPSWISNTLLPPLHDPYGLIPMSDVQGKLVFCTNGHMEDGRAHIGDAVENAVVVVYLSNEVSAAGSHRE